MKIYIDILLITNGIMTMIYLETFGKLLHKKTKSIRFFTACCIGGLSSLLIAAKGVSFFSAIMITLTKFIFTVLTVSAAFNFKNIWELFKNTIIYIFIQSVFIGITLVIWQISDAKIIYMKNYTVYFDISLLHLIIATASAYLIISLYEIISRKVYCKTKKYKATYKLSNIEITLPAIADTGNQLCDSFSGTPIVIFYCNELYYYFNLDDPDYETLSGFRLVPYKTVMGSSLMHVTPKGEVTIIDEENNFKTVNCYVGIVKSENEKSKAIFNPNLLI